MCHNYICVLSLEIHVAVDVVVLFLSSRWQDLIFFHSEVVMNPSIGLFTVWLQGS